MSAEDVQQEFPQRALVYWLTYGAFAVGAIALALGVALYFFGSNNIGVEDVSQAAAVQGSFPTGCPESAAFISRLTAQPDTAHTSAYQDLICDLATKGVWQKLDAFYMLAAADAPTAQTNLVQGKFNLTQINAPRFVVDRGFNGDGTSSYLDTGFVPSTAGGRWTATSTAFGVYFVDIANTKGAVREFGSDKALLQFQNSKKPQFLVNAASTKVPSTLYTNGTVAVSRSGAGLSFFNNGSLTSTSTVPGSSFVYTRPLLIGAAYISGLMGYGTNQQAAVFFGGSLSADDMAEIHAGIDRYLTAVGALDFYLDLSSATDGDGTLASPWNSLSRPNAWTGELHDRRLLLKAGSSARSALAINKAKDFSILPYGEGAKPKIDGSDPIDPALWQQHSTSTYYLPNQTIHHQVWIDNARMYAVKSLATLIPGTQYFDKAAGRIYVMTPDRDNPAAHVGEITARIAVMLNDDNGVQVYGIHSEKSDKNAVEVHYTSNITIDNVLASNFGSQQTGDNTGFDIIGKPAAFISNIAVKNSEAAGGYNCSLQTHFVDGILVTENYFHDNEQGIELWDTTRNGIFSRNIVTRIGYGIPPNSAFKGHGNFVWAADDSGQSLHNNNQYFGNVVSYTASDAIDIDAGTNHYFYNNTFYRAAELTSGISMVNVQKIGTPEVSVFFYNNIAVMGPVSRWMLDVARTGASWTADYNTYYTIPGGRIDSRYKYNNIIQTNFAAYKAASGQDAHSIQLDPMLVNPLSNDLGIKTGSPAAAAGDPAHVAPYDFLGSPFGTPPNMGAYAGLDQ